MLEMYQQVIDLLPEANLVFRLKGKGPLIQHTYKIKPIFEKLPKEFTDKFNVHNECIMGLETIVAGSVLGTHTDYKPRVSNLLINITDHPITIVHSNTGVLTEHTIEPDDYVMVNVSKEHGCNETYDFDASFLTVNHNDGIEHIEIPGP